MKKSKPFAITILTVIMIILFTLTEGTPVKTVTQYFQKNITASVADQKQFKTEIDIDPEILAIPELNDGNIIVHTGFSLLYSEEHEQASWVSYVLTNTEVLGKVPRSNNFKEDPFINTGSAALLDYKGSGYDRGHLAPAGDLKWSESSMRDSFFMSNMSPQAPG
ncbi:MAG: DNA/RNA non-specific endonuclease, partial [Spirochaetales bacterium]|nr:DNA/RNA non-specific endonuclease [Spirochaetales bacterium]